MPRLPAGVLFRNSTGIRKVIPGCGLSMTWGALLVLNPPMLRLQGASIDRNNESAPPVHEVLSHAALVACVGQPDRVHTCTSLPCAAFLQDATVNQPADTSKGCCMTWHVKDPTDTSRTARQQMCCHLQVDNICDVLPDCCCCHG